RKPSGAVKAIFPSARDVGTQSFALRERTKALADLAFLPCKPAEAPRLQRAAVADVHGALRKVRSRDRLHLTGYVTWYRRHEVHPACPLARIERAKVLRPCHGDHQIEAVRTEIVGNPPGLVVLVLLHHDLQAVVSGELHRCVEIQLE